MESTNVFLMVSLGPWISGTKNKRWSYLLFTWYQVCMRLRWLITNGVHLDHLAKVMFAGFLHCRYAPPLLSWSILCKLSMQQSQQSRGGELSFITHSRWHLYKWFGILLYGRFFYLVFISCGLMDIYFIQ